jgi:hypothetical protein
MDLLAAFLVTAALVYGAAHGIAIRVAPFMLLPPAVVRCYPGGCAPARLVVWREQEGRR